MKNVTIATKQLKIQEGEWIITMPVEDTILDLKKVVEKLRFTPYEGLVLKVGWSLKHI